MTESPSSRSLVASRSQLFARAFIVTLSAGSSNPAPQQDRSWHVLGPEQPELERSNALLTDARVPRLCPARMRKPIGRRCAAGVGVGAGCVSQSSYAVAIAA